jgi:hypothetical protein
MKRICLVVALLGVSVGFYGCPILTPVMHGIQGEWLADGTSYQVGGDWFWFEVDKSIKFYNNEFDYWFEYRQVSAFGNVTAISYRRLKGTFILDESVSPAIITLQAERSFYCEDDCSPGQALEDVDFDIFGTVELDEEDSRYIHLVIPLDEDSLFPPEGRMYSNGPIDDWGD